MLKWMDLAEDERKEQYKNRYILEHNYHLQDMKQDHVENERRLRRIKMARFREPMNRGYDIVTNVGFGGRQGVPPHPPYPTEQPSAWEVMTAGPPGGANGPAMQSSQSATKVAEKTKMSIESPVGSAAGRAPRESGNSGRGAPPSNRSAGSGRPAPALSTRSPSNRG